MQIRSLKLVKENNKINVLDSVVNNKTDGTSEKIIKNFSRILIEMLQDQREKANDEDE